MCRQARRRIFPSGRRAAAEAKVFKGARRMPRLLQAMKDVISCDKPR